MGGDADIRKHRTADAALTVLGEGGKPVANSEVVVEQKSHKFLFGCTGSGLIAYINDEVKDEQEKAKAERHEKNWLGLFNFCTLPFYWGRFERERGKPDTKRILKAAKWFKDRGAVVKGHPLCWHTVCADWLMPLSNEQIVKEQRARIEREVRDFAGVIDMWDVINEVVIMPVFDKYDNAMTRICRDVLGRIGIIRMTFEACRATNPGAVLLLNDFDMSTAYECLIEGVLEAGIKIDVLGLQSHMHQGYWGVEKTLNVLERFSRYGLPIHFTESTLVSGQIMAEHIVDLNDYQVDEWPTTPEGEQRQAEEAVLHYKTLMAHPAVEGITWWGLGDGGWLKAPSGLVRADQTPKPAYERLHGLVKGEWWMGPTKMKTDGQGRVRFNGFLGGYVVSSNGRGGFFDLDVKGEAAVEARLK